MEAEYHALTKKMESRLSRIADPWKDMFFAKSSSFLRSPHAPSILALSGPQATPDPTIIQTAPQARLLFLWLYALLSTSSSSAGDTISSHLPAF